MRHTTRNLVTGSLIAFSLALHGTGSTAQAQGPVRLAIDPKTSLSWWQVNPHMEHLWATTCPQDPSWRPGEGRSMAWAADFLSKGAGTGHSNRLVDSSSIPLYPRRRVRPVCADAVRGEITVDTVNWTSAHGVVTVKAAQLLTGADMRDNYAQKSILQSAAHPDILYTIDSLGEIRKADGGARGDTLYSTIYGTFELRGVHHPMVAHAKTTHEAGGLRVRAKFMMPARDMVEVYGMSKMALGLGVGQTVWEELWMGVDVVLKDPAAP